MITKIFQKKYRIRELSLIWWVLMFLKCAIFFGLFLSLMWWVS